MTRLAQKLVFIIVVLVGLWLVLNRLSTKHSCPRIPGISMNEEVVSEPPLLDIEREQKEHWDDVFSTRS